MKLRDNLYFYPWESLTENNCNSYLIEGAVRTLIDPGHLHLIPELEAKMAQDGFALEDVQLVIATHPHPDHCEGLLAFQDLPARAAMHREAERHLREFGRHWQQLSGKDVPAIQPDFYLQQGQLRLGDNHLRVIETPGHAPGSICLYWEEEKALFSGDVVFHQGVGRIDLPGGDAVLLSRSIQSLLDLDVELLLPGHGPPVGGKGAVKENFYLIRTMFQQML